MNFIKKIVDKQVDGMVHLQFQKFSKGEFRNRALVKVKKSKNKFTITTTAEFANELVKAIAKKLGDGKTNITGAVVSTNDLTEELDFKEKKQFQGVKRYLIDSEMSGREILNLLEKFPKAFFALSFEVGDSKLKIKPKAPKSAKPKSKDGPIKPDFCKLITTDADIGMSFAFDAQPDFKEALFEHTFFIDDIVVPEELKSEKDFALIREKALRKGRILREYDIDGIEGKKEIEFEA